MPFDTGAVDVTAAGPDSTDCDPAAPALGGVWYRFTPSVNGYVRGTAQTNDPARAGQVMVFGGGSCGGLTQLSCPGFDGTNPPVAVTAGQTYWFLVSVSPTREDQFLDSPGPVLYGTTVTAQLEVLQPPSNDHCATAQVVSATPAMIDVDTTLADADGPRPACIGFGSAVSNAVWYKLTAQTGGTLTVHGAYASGTYLYAPGGALFSGSCASLTQVACDSPLDGFFITDHFDITAELTAGTSYYLMVGAYAAPNGGGTVVTIDYTGELGGGCVGDFNHSGAVSVQDIFDFLTAYFTADPSADVNHSGTVSVQDIFDFLGAYFAGCS